MIGSGKVFVIEEDTLIGWNGTPVELVIFQMLDGFEKQKRHPILEEGLVKIGVSLKAQMKCENVFQILYIKQSSNRMD